MKKEVKKKNNWPLVELGELENKGEIEFLRGNGLSKKSISENGKNKCILYGELYTLYSPIIKDVFSKTDEKGKVFSKEGDVLFPNTTTADAMGIAIARSLNQNNIIIGSDISIVRTNNKLLLGKFLSFLINFPLKRNLARYAKGTNILHISNKDIKKIKIPLPPIKEQEAIVGVLSSLDYYIESVEKLIEEQEQVGRSIFQHFLNTKQKYQLVELGEVVIDMKDGGTPSRKKLEYFGGNIHWARIEDIKPIIKDTNEKITELGLSKSSTKLWPINSVIISLGATIGKIGINKIPLCTKQGISGIIPDKEKILYKFLYYVLLSRASYIKNNFGGGATFKDIRPKELLNNFKFSLPPIKEQEDIVNKITASDNLVESQKKLLLSLNILKKSLSENLLTGKVRVKI